MHKITIIGHLGRDPVGFGHHLGTLKTVLGTTLPRMSAQNGHGLFVWVEGVGKQLTSCGAPGPSFP